MTPCCLLHFLVLCYFPLLLLAQLDMKKKFYESCPLYSHCGDLGDIYFPFSFSNTTSSECSLPIRGCDGKAEVRLGNKTWCQIERIEKKYGREPDSIIVQDNELLKYLPKNCSDCHHDIPLHLLSSPKIFEIKNIITLYRCNRTSNTSNVNFPESFYSSTVCPDYDIRYIYSEDLSHSLPIPASSCLKIQVPYDPDYSQMNGFKNFSFNLLSARLHIKVNLPEKCLKCYETADICFDKEESYCSKAKEKPETWKVILIVGSVFSCTFAIIIIILFIYKRRITSSCFKNQSRSIGGDPHSNGDQECSRIFFGIPVFSYKELEEATNNFDPTRELGEGGYGTVYYGKLQDGREVAVKRLYERNYKRVQQFTTEIKILTRLRHTNLVTLYGCTSRHGRELLLVYEYIPNGTVACHLHGDLAKPGSLPWSVRMKIAIETASALAYLHATDIIHRDVKTNNFLLDNHFCVKVADFGLSRLFPNDVTHVSTAPQGTPGYLDPEYHRYYQLTNKSDVYSFGVVLVELISSKPAIDITRHRDAINLASLAVRKIQNSALSELVDPSLGFESDNEVKRMIVSVAELAFQCLQLDRDMRPDMDQVLRMLERIENGTDEQEHLEEEDPHEVRISNSYIHPPPSLSPEHDEIGPMQNLNPTRFHQTL